MKCTAECSVGKNPVCGDICPSCEEAFPKNLVTEDHEKYFWKEPEKACVELSKCGKWTTGSYGYCYCRSTDMVWGENTGGCQPKNGKWDTPQLKAMCESSERFITLDKKDCVYESDCGQYQKGLDGYCACIHGYVANVDSTKCVEDTSCKRNFRNEGGKCVCNDGLYLNIAGTDCVSADKCGLYQEVKSGADQCTCKGSLVYDISKQ